MTALDDVQVALVQQAISQASKHLPGLSLVISEAAVGITAAARLPGDIQRNRVSATLLVLRASVSGGFYFFNITTGKDVRLRPEQLLDVHETEDFLDQMVREILYRGTQDVSYRSL